MAKVNYDKNVDYQALINEAVAKGDMVAAANYERQRNAKIADMNGDNLIDISDLAYVASNMPGEVFEE